MNNSTSNIPEGWYVAKAGQNPLHMLWFVCLVNFDDVANKKENVRSYYGEEKDSFDEALEECLKQQIEDERKGNQKSECFY